MPRRDLEDSAEQHAAGTGDGIVLFSATRHGLSYAARNGDLDGLPERRSLFLHLTETRRIDVEGGDLEQKFSVIENREIIVDPPRGLRQAPLWIQRSVGSERVAPGRKRA